MIAFAKFVINDVSVNVLEYPEITIPEQELKKKKINDKTTWCYDTHNETKQPHTKRWVISCDGFATLNFFFSHAQSIL